MEVPLDISEITNVGFVSAQQSGDVNAPLRYVETVLRGLGEDAQGAFDEATAQEYAYWLHVQVMLTHPQVA